MRQTKQSDMIAEYICKQRVPEAVCALLGYGCKVVKEDGETYFYLGDYVFFQAYPDSKTLTYEV